MESEPCSTFIAPPHLDEDPRQQQLRHHQPRRDGQRQVHAGHRRAHGEAHRSAAVGDHGHDGVEPQDPICTLTIQASEIGQK